VVEGERYPHSIYPPGGESKPTSDSYTLWQFLSYRISIILVNIRQKIGGMLYSLYIIYPPLLYKNGERNMLNAYLFFFLFLFQ
jgi:hypothetical protein